MPARPRWWSRLDEIVADLEALPSPVVTRRTIEFLLRVGPRRAQQLMAPCVTEQIGTSLTADRELLLAHLRTLAAGENAQYETERRRKLAGALHQLRENWISAPKVLIEAPTSIVNQDFGDLPTGIELGPGRIALNFASPSEALEKLLALAMAIGRDMDRFEKLISTPAGVASTQTR